MTEYIDFLLLCWERVWVCFNYTVVYEFLVNNNNQSYTIAEC